MSGGWRRLCGLTWSGGSRETDTEEQRPGRGPGAAASGNAGTRRRHGVPARPGGGGHVTELFLLRAPDCHTPTIAPLALPPPT
ncbi:hypothetical protein NDU88_000330 [Pleurodeles waltl]|uniref:Uncharacterized protein n=1 Tax=Pleurodeles waltl TaxID=8319 RepID=A0AAV7TEP3_PLEWA|nr:hypothetical protein NDU88_000330 [Pleurodeles waltl]